MSTNAVFPDIGLAGWQALVAKALKGAPIDRLKTPTRDGYVIEPLYQRARDAVVVAPERGAMPWGVVQRIDLPDVAEANRQILADLEGGADGLDLVFSTSPHARGYGIAASDPAAIERLLASVDPRLITLHIDAGAETAAIATRIIDVLAASGIAASELRLTTLIDPIGLAARNGGTEAGLGPAIAAAGDAAERLGTRGFAGTILSADGRVWHEAGAGRAETLAAMLATTVAYWRALEAAGLEVAEAAGRIAFILPVDQNQFSGIADIRALRLLWARATSAAGLTPARARIHAETSLRMMSRLDANTNQIRLTVAAFAAGVGGADTVAVLPFSAANGLADAFARRLSRNLQLMLIEESNLAKVADPAAGSGRVEAETRSLAEAAWTLFRAIEAEGGIGASLTAGRLQARIAATAEARARDIARRKEPLTGVSEFPLFSEPAVAVLDLPALACEPPPIGVAFPALAGHRVSEPFEALREAARATSPAVFLANLGAIADFTARATWVKNLFEAGGIAVVSNDGFATQEDLVEAFVASGTRAVCLVSSDAIYGEQALASLARLKAAGAAPMFFAGKPMDTPGEAALRQAGVDRFATAGLDLLSFLAEAQALISGARR
ncbi:MAG: methylmalonyl-CoA mutase family protein [Ancalomicrobiaceae bacterium]|nr:methylmalonyl-CoA mutase family protein [Ancalomicrobiaceae bacterium]